jgi:hypothetical protein
VRISASAGISCDRYQLRELSSLRSARALYLRIDHGGDYSAVAWHLRPAVFCHRHHLPHSWRKIRHTAVGMISSPAHGGAGGQLSKAFGCRWPAIRSPRLIGSPLTRMCVRRYQRRRPAKFYLQALRERY